MGLRLSARCGREQLDLEGVADVLNGREAEGTRDSTH